MPRTDHAEMARDHLARADVWANRDNVDAETRARVVGFNLEIAKVHASLAIAQSTDTVASVLEDRIIPALERALAR